jgi:hypothetical protein
LWIVWFWTSASLSHTHALAKISYASVCFCVSSMGFFLS